MAAKVGQVVVDFLLNTAKFDSDMKRASRSFKNLGSDFANVGRTLTMSVTAPLVGAGAAAIKVAGEFEQTKIAFNTMLGSADKSTKFLKQLQDFATSTPFEFKDLTQASKRMMALGFSSAQVLPTLRIIGDTVAGLGGGAEMIDRVTLALGQMQAKGKVSAQEMNQLAESGIPAWELLSKAIGKSIPEAMKLAEKGAIASSIAIPAILAGMGSKFGGLMDKQSKTLLGQLSNLKDQFFFIMRDFGTELIPVATKIMNDFIKPAADGLRDLVKWFGSLSKEEQGLILKTAALTAAIGPLMWAFGSFTSGMASMLPLFSKAIGLISGGGGLIGSIKNLGAAAVVTGAVFAGWKIAEWIDKLDLFGRHAAVATNNIIKQAEAYHKEAQDIGAINAAMAKYKSLVDSGAISQNTFNGILTDLSKQRHTETLEQYRDRMKQLVDQYKTAHPELFKVKAASEQAAPASEALAQSFNIVTESLKENQPWLNKYTDDITFYSEAVDALYQNMVKRQRGQQDMLDSIQGDTPRTKDLPDLELGSSGFGDAKANINEVSKTMDDYRKGIAGASENTSGFGREVSTIFTNMTQNIAQNIVEWKGWGQTLLGTVKSLAQGLLSELIQGFFTRLLSYMSGAKNSFGNFFGSILGGGSGIGGGGGGGILGGITNALGLGGKGNMGGLASAAGGVLMSGAGLPGMSAAMAAEMSAMTGATVTAGGGVAATGLTGALGLGGGAGLFGLGAATIPVVGAAIAGLTFAGIGLAKWAKGKNSFEAMHDEAKRDFGVNISQKQIAAFLAANKISEAQAWSRRGDIMLSPKFQDYMLSIGLKPNVSKSKYYSELADELAAGTKGNWSPLTEWYLKRNGGGAGKLAGFESLLSMSDQGYRNNQNRVPLSVFHQGTDYVPRTGLYELEKGEAVIKASENRGARNVSIRGGDVHLSLSINGGNSADLERTFKTRIIPMIKNEIDKGNSGLRESVARSVRITQGAY